jgi:hypothetical protein
MRRTKREKLLQVILTKDAKTLSHMFVSACPNSFIKTECKICRDDMDCERCWETFLNNKSTNITNKKENLYGTNRDF